MPPSALIITLQLDEPASASLSALRRLHFPAHRNWLAAHITLFHALPTCALDDVLNDLAEKTRQTFTFAMIVDRVLFLGQGVAYAILSEEGLQLRRELAERWGPLLVPQDRRWHGPLHVTVQNKVDPATAKKLFVELVQTFVPYNVQAVGLQIWKYAGGPWDHVATLPFKDLP